MYHVEFVAMLTNILQRVRPHELKRVSFLLVDIHPHNLESGTVVTSTAATCTTEQIQQSRSLGNDSEQVVVPERRAAFSPDGSAASRRPVITVVSLNGKPLGAV